MLPAIWGTSVASRLLKNTKEDTMSYSALKVLALFVSWPLFSAQAVQAQAVYENKKDGFTGEDRSYVFIQPSSVTGDTFLIAWRCEYDGLNVVLAHNFLAGDSDDEVVVLYKFDEGDPSGNNYYDLSGSNKLTYFDMSDVPAFTQKALNSQKLMVRLIDPSDQETATGTFFLKGLSQNLPKLPCR